MKSIFAKYIAVFASIVLASFLMLTYIIAVTLNNYYDMQAKKEVEKVADVTSKIISMDWNNEDDVPIQDKEGFYEMLEGMGKTVAENVTLIVTSETGSVMGRSDRRPPLPGEPASEPEASEVSAEIVSFTLENGYYDGVTDLGMLGREYQIYGKVILHGDTPAGLVFAYSDGREANGLFQLMNKSVLMSSLWVLLAALVVVYFVSDRMVRPIKSMSAAVNKFAKGNFEDRVTVTGKDEIAELAEGLNKMADSLAQMDKMRNSFLANVSHDLRTPMTAIAGFIDGIKSGAIPPEKHEYYLNIISSEIHRLSRLVSQILDVSRLASGERKFTFAKCDLCETARIVLISFEQKIDAKHLDVEFEAEEDSLYVTADKDAIHQVIYNLCENAIKFSKEGGKLRITLQREDKKRISCRVYNEGIGIAKEDLPYVFNQFYKTDKSRGLDKNGVGLGLYIVKSIVDAHEGEITVDSVEGEMCVFTVTLRETE